MHVHCIKWFSQLVIIVTIIIIIIVCMVHIWQTLLICVPTETCKNTCKKDMLGPTISCFVERLSGCPLLRSSKCIINTIQENEYFGLWSVSFVEKLCKCPCVMIDIIIICDYFRLSVTIIQYTLLCPLMVKLFCC